MLQFADELPGPKIKVIGVGGGGGNSVNTMIEAGVQGVDFVAANTDCQVLDTNQAGMKVHMGKALTKGLGAGANPEIGCAAAIEDASRLAEVLQGADMVFVTAGMGGGTGTGAAPVIAQVARDMGALTVGVVTRPFAFEGVQRKRKASGGIAELAKAVDALIVIPNDRLVALAGMKMTLRESFAMVDNVCVNAVRGISDLVMIPGLINVDFADVRTIMTGMGRALMGTGRGTGENRATLAAQGAINSPLLEDVSINGATGILVNITGGPDLTLAEVNDACSLIQEAADPDANIIFGSVIDPNCGDEVRITVIATGFQTHAIPEIPGLPQSSHRGSRRGSENQMALPMQATSLGTVQSQVPIIGMNVPIIGMSVPIVGSTPSSAVASPRTPDPIDISDLALEAYPASAAYPGTANAYAPNGYGAAPLAYAQTPTASYGVPVAASPFPPAVPMAPAPSAPMTLGTDWSSPQPTQGSLADSRPIIRPPVMSSQAVVGSGSGIMPPQRRSGAMTAEDLGIEESEFDKPTYLRRGMVSPDPGSSASFRVPTDNSGKY